MSTQSEQTHTQTQTGTHNFEAEISQLLNIIINNFYSEKEIFLRELISNASDAIDKVRYQHLQSPESNVLGEETEFRIRIIPDRENNRLIIEDTGIGMTAEDLVKNLGTIAHSGTKQFMERLTHGGDMSMIGKFGVGFYSSFLVADQVDVYSRHYSSDTTYCWTSKGEGSFNVMPVENTDIIRGTRLVLHMREEQLQYLNEDTLKDIISRHSQFISYPISLLVVRTKEPEQETEIDEDANEEHEMAESEIDLNNVENSLETTETQVNEEVILEEEDMEQFNLNEKADEQADEHADEHADEQTDEHVDEQTNEPETYTEYEVLNKTVPIWMKPRNEITGEEYTEFYKTISNDWEEPLTHIHFQVEGNITFRGLLYIPRRAPFELFQTRQKMNNIKLYVRRVFITDDCQKFVPDYLNFVKGVIDSDDLPLNVSREMLQYNKVFDSIKKQLTRKVIDMLISLADDEDKYNTFYEAFSKNIKLGVHEDGDRRQKLASLLRYYSSKSNNKLTSLDNYISNMREGQNDIYYITGENMESVASSTHLDVFHKKELEVLFMTEAIDEYCVNQLNSYKDHNLVNVTRQNVDLPETEEEKKELEEKKTTYKRLCEAVKKALGNHVSTVLISKRLTRDPCCVSVGEHGWTANMEKIMKAQAMSDANTLNFMKSQRCFELNPDHRIIKSLNESVEHNNGEPDIGTTNLINLLFETALQDAGFSVNSPRIYAHRVYSMVELGLGYEPSNEQNTEQNIEQNTENYDELPDLDN